MKEGGREQGRDEEQEGRRKEIRTARGRERRGKEAHMLPPAGANARFLFKS